MKRLVLKLLIILAALGAAAWLSGCNLPATPTSEPICDAAHLQSAEITSPTMWQVLSSRIPVITWTYPGTDCVPAEYHIRVEVGPDFGTAYNFTVDNSTHTFTLPDPLPPATMFRVGLAAIASDGSARGTLMINFFTPPVCDDPNELLAPTLLRPVGETYDPAHDAGLTWDYPGDCLPDGYRIEVSTDSSFSDIGLNGGTSNPSTVWGVGRPLEQCQEYFWRVAALKDTPYGELVIGPYSAAGTFIVQPQGVNCATGGMTPPPAASIMGTVWEDQCELSGGALPDPLPTGCTPDGSGSARADGIRQAGEPGLANIEVTLHSGADCTSAPIAVTTTDADGVYRFESVDLGTYCVSVDAALNGLTPGLWTQPLTTDTEAAQTASLATGDVSTLDFGWYHQQAALSVTPQFQFDKNAFCRRGPGKAYPDITAIPAGETLPVLGRSPDGGWLYVRWEAYDVDCWVSNITGTLLGSLDDLIVMTPVPLPPTPTPTTAPNNPPTISDFRALESEVYYPNGANCGSTLLNVTARLQDADGIDEDQTRLMYRYVSNRGDASPWYRVPIHDRAMGGQVGFIIDVGTEADNTLAGGDGRVEYQVKAFDNYGSQSTSNTLSTPIGFCP